MLGLIKISICLSPFSYSTCIYSCCRAGCKHYWSRPS